MPSDMRKRIRIYSLFYTGIVCLLTAGLYSCKTKQPQTSDTGSAGAGKIRSTEELWTHINARVPKYQNLNIRFAAQIKTGKNENSVRGKLKIRRDSCVWASALPFGIEAARILATQTETGMVLYLDKKYFQGGYEMLSAQVGYPLNYPMLEAALTGTPVFQAEKGAYRFYDEGRNGYYFSPYTPTDFEKITEDKITPADGASMVQALWFETDRVSLSKNVLYDVAQKRYLEIIYSNPMPAGNDTLPTGIHIIIRTPKETTDIALEYTKTEADVPDMEYPFTIPASYQRMELK